MKRKQVVGAQQILFDVEKTVPTSTICQKGKNQDSFVFDIMDVLTAPILTFSQAWADTIPQRLLDIVKLARIIALKKGEELASFPEVSIYIYTRTLESPMDSDWTAIYTHVSCKVWQDWFKEDRWDAVEAPKTLTDWQLSKLKRLRLYLYETRRKMLKNSLKAEKKESPVENKSNKTEKSKPTQLPSLFSEE